MRFRILGTEIYVSFLFAAVIAFMIATDRTGLILPTLAAVFIHETGHLFAMWLAECPLKRIRLIPASVQIVRGFSSKPKGEIMITAFGPAANLVTALALALNYVAFKNAEVLKFSVLNLIIGVFNLLPVSGLDGGTLLAALISKRKDERTALGAVRIITAVLSAVVFVVGTVMWANGKFNISVYIVSLYLAVCCILKRT